MLRRKKFWKRVLYVVASFAALLLILFIYLVIVSKAYPPNPADTASLQWQRTEQSNGFYTLKNSWFRKSKSGLYELYVEGEPFEQGVVNGRLTKELVQRQEDHF